MTFDPDANKNQRSKLLAGLVKAISETTGDSWTLRSGAKTFDNIETGQDTVTTSGTAVQLNGGTSLTVPDGASVSVTALPGNSGNIYIGDDTVDSSSGDVLTSDTSVSIPISDVSSVYIDADNNGEGVSWITEVN